MELHWKMLIAAFFGMLYARSYFMVFAYINSFNSHRDLVKWVYYHRHCQDGETELERGFAIDQRQKLKKSESRNQSLNPSIKDTVLAFSAVWKII